MNLKKMYERSIKKWEKVECLVYTNHLDEAFELMTSPCAFCKDAMKRRVSTINECHDCRINHHICGSVGSLITKIDNDQKDTFLEGVRNMLKALKKESDRYYR